MNSGREPGPEDPRGSRPPPDVPSGEDEEADWPTWRQGAGYSRPTPPDPEPEHHAEEVVLSRHDHDTHARPDSRAVRPGRRFPAPARPGRRTRPGSGQPGQSGAAAPGGV